MCTVTEPHALWAIEADPVELRAAFAIDDAPGVVFAPDITFYRERKIRMLNGAHTATAPLALLAGVPTVREAAEHPRLGPFLHRILFDEIPAGTDLPAETAASYARQVLDRFRNPWLAHPWQVIATNQTAKFRLRVAPSIVGFVRRRRSVPQGLALGCAAYLRVARAVADGTYSIADADLPAIDRHGDAAAVAAGTLPDSSLASLPGFLDDVKGWLLRLERDGVDAALDTLARAEVP